MLSMTQHYDDGLSFHSSSEGSVRIVEYLDPGELSGTSLPRSTDGRSPSDRASPQTEGSGWVSQTWQWLKARAPGIPLRGRKQRQRQKKRSKRRHRREPDEASHSGRAPDDEDDHGRNDNGVARQLGHPAPASSLRGGPAPETLPFGCSLVDPLNTTTTSLSGTTNEPPVLSGTLRPAGSRLVEVPTVSLEPAGGPSPVDDFLDALSHSSRESEEEEGEGWADEPPVRVSRRGALGLLSSLVSGRRASGPRDEAPVLVRSTDPPSGSAGSQRGRRSRGEVMTPIQHKDQQFQLATRALASPEPRQPGHEVPGVRPLPPPPLAAEDQLGGVMNENGHRHVVEAPLGPDGVPLEHYTLDPSSDPFGTCNANPMMRTVRRTKVAELQGVEMNDGMEGHNPTATEGMSVDLTSALRGYLESYSECMTHLVEAALAGRCKENHNLVTLEELREADGNPFLIRMMVVKGALDVEDEGVQKSVSDVMHTLIEESSYDELNPVLFDYLVEFFRLPFISLTEAEYRVLKRSGFEFITLMHANQHVLPKSKTIFSIRVNNSSRMWWINFMFMILGFVVNTVVSVAVIYEISKWLLKSSGPDVSYGFYACITVAGGYVLMLMLVIVVLRPVLVVSESTLPKRQKVPSLYLNVIPLIPLYDLVAIVKFVQLRRIPEQERYLVAMHNLFAMSRVLGVYHCLLYAVPQNQFAAAISFDPLGVFPSLKSGVSLLTASTTVQFLVVIFRVTWMCLVYDSIHRFGFAWYSLSRWRHGIEAHAGMSRALLIVFFFVLESHLFLTILCTVKAFRAECVLLSITCASVSFATCVLIIVVLALFKKQSELPLVRLSAICALPLTVATIAIIMLLNWPYREECKITFTVINDDFSFGYIVQGTYLLLFVVWSFTLLLLLLRKNTKMPISRFLSIVEKLSCATAVVDQDRNGTGTQPAKLNRRRANHVAGISSSDGETPEGGFTSSDTSSSAWGSELEDHSTRA